MVVTVVGIVTDSKLTQRSNKPLLIALMLVGIVTDNNPELANANQPDNKLYNNKGMNK